MDRKKIIFVAADFSAFAGSCHRTLSRMGHEVLPFNYRSSIFFSNIIIRRLSKAFPSIKGRVKRDINRRLIKAAELYKPDLIFSIKAEIIEPETVDYIKRLGITTINWFPDHMWNWDSIEKLAPVYNFFFSPDHHILTMLRERGLNNGFYLPFASELNDDTPDPFNNRKEEFNIAMIGMYSKEYYSVRDRCLANIKDLGLHIWGTENWNQSKLKDNYRDRIIGAEKVADIYRRSKIVVNTHYNEEPAEGISLRPFEAMGAGALLICDDGRKDVFRLFKDGEEFLSFPDGGSDELRELVKYYLSHPEERLEIARRGYEKIKNNHTLLIRMREMFDVVKIHTLNK